MIIDVNNKEVRAFTIKLQQMHRSNFPIVVRQTLNDLAFDVKTVSLKQQYEKQFIRRDKTFLKSHSGVVKASGFNITSMKSEVGIIEKQGSEKASQGLGKQEYGQSVKKPVVYMKSARSGSNKRKVVAGNYYNKYQKIRGLHANVGRHTRKSNFVASAIMAHKLGKLLMWDSKSGQTIFLVQSIYLAANSQVDIKLKAIADYEDKRVLNLKARPFLQPASLLSHNKVNSFFLKNAQKRLNR